MLDKLIEIGPISWKSLFIDQRQILRDFFFVRHLQKLWALLYLAIVVAMLYGSGTFGLRRVIYDERGIPLWVFPVLFGVWGVGLLLISGRVRYWQLLFFWCIPFYAYFTGLVVIHAPLTVRLFVSSIVVFMFITSEQAESIEQLRTDDS